MPRVGSKRSDKRWIGKDGQQWDSRLEEEIFEYLTEVLGESGSVRRAGEGDSFDYTQARPRVRCLECGSNQCAQLRSYTPDLYVDTGTHQYWLEIKGFFSQPKRALFRSFRKTREDIVVRVVAQRDHKVGKGRLSDYFARYLKTTPLAVWLPGKQLPEDWIT